MGTAAGFPTPNAMSGFGMPGTPQIPGMGMTPGWPGSIPGAGVAPPINAFVDMPSMDGPGGDDFFPGAGYGMGGPGLSPYSAQTATGSHFMSPAANMGMNSAVGGVGNTMAHPHTAGGVAQAGSFHQSPQQIQQFGQHHHHPQQQQQHQQHLNPSQVLSASPMPPNAAVDVNSVSTPKSTPQGKISKLLSAFRKASGRGKTSSASTNGTSWHKPHSAHSSPAHSQSTNKPNMAHSYLRTVADKVLTSNITLPVGTSQSQDAVIRLDKLLATMIDTILADAPPEQRARAQAKLGLTSMQALSALNKSPPSTSLSLSPSASSSSSATSQISSMFNPSSEIANGYNNNNLHNTSSTMGDVLSTSSFSSPSLSSPSAGALSFPSYDIATAPPSVTPGPFSNLYTASHLAVSGPSLEFTNSNMGIGEGGGGVLGGQAGLAVTGMVTHALSPSLSHAQDGAASASPSPSSTSPPSSPLVPGADVSQAYDTVAKALNMTSPELRQLLEARAVENANRQQQQAQHTHHTPPPVPVQLPPTTTPAPWVPPETPEPPEAPEAGEGGMNPFLFAQLASDTGMAAMAMANELGVRLFNPGFTPEFQSSLLNFLGYSAY